ncbi:MAG TPA: hypothetical protein VIH42_01975 [Thermoguttaceae bacterium]
MLNVKSRVGILIATLSIVLGVAGLLLDVAGRFPLPLPDWFLPFTTIFGLFLTYLGWNDDLAEGKKYLTDLLKNLISKPYIYLAVTALAELARKVIAAPELFDPALTVVAQVVLTLLEVLGIGVAYIKYATIPKIQQKTESMRTKKA